MNGRRTPLTLTGVPPLEGELQRRRRLRRRAPLARHAIEPAAPRSACGARRCSRPTIETLGAGRASRPRRRIRVHQRRRPDEAAGAGAQRSAPSPRAARAGWRRRGRRRGPGTSRSPSPRSRSSDLTTAASRSSRASGTPPCCAPHALSAGSRNSSASASRTSITWARTAPASSARLAHAVEVLALAEVEGQRHHFVAFDLDEVPDRRRLDRPARERERDACLVSH